MLTAEDYKAIHPDIQLGLEDDTVVWIVKSRVLDSKCDKGHNHWKYHVTQHNDLIRALHQAKEYHDTNHHQRQ